MSLVTVFIRKNIVPNRAIVKTSAISRYTNTKDLTIYIECYKHPIAKAF